MPHADVEAGRADAPGLFMGSGACPQGPRRAGGEWHATVAAAAAACLHLGCCIAAIGMHADIPTMTAGQQQQMLLLAARLQLTIRALWAAL